MSSSNQSKSSFIDLDIFKDIKRLRRDSDENFKSSLYLTRLLTAARYCSLLKSKDTTEHLEAFINFIMEIYIRFH